MRNRLLQLLADNRQAPGRRFEVVAKEDEDEATVYLYDAIVDDELMAEYWGGVAAAPFVKALHAITAKTIHLRINCPGGSVFAARAIEQALREHSSRVIAHIDGVAASAASFVMMGADEIVIAPGGMVMIHKGWTIAWGNADELRKVVDLLDKFDGTILDTYQARTKQDRDQLADWLAAETWFTSEEAVEHGFADRVADSSVRGDDGMQNAVRWNLSAYLTPPKPVQASGQVVPEQAELRSRHRQRLAALARPPIV